MRKFGYEYLDTQLCGEAHNSSSCMRGRRFVKKQTIRAERRDSKSFTKQALKESLENEILNAIKSAKDDAEFVFMDIWDNAVLRQEEELSKPFDEDDLRCVTIQNDIHNEAVSKVLASRDWQMEQDDYEQSTLKALIENLLRKY